MNTNTNAAVNFYNTNGTEIVRTRTYTTRQGAARAIRRAAERGQIAAMAGRRTANDSPTCHH